jgi:hypothetical protein
MEAKGSIPQNGLSTDIPTTAELKGKTVVDKLVELGEQDQYALFRDQYGTPHALVDGEPVPLDNNAHGWLRKLYWNVYSKVPKHEELGSAVATLAMFASHSPRREVHIRAMRHDGNVYVWLGPNRVVEVSEQGWRCVTPMSMHDIQADEQGRARARNPWLLFRNVETLKALPDPEPGGDLNRLNHFIRLKNDRDRRLNIAWAVTAYIADIPRPIN